MLYFTENWIRETSLRSSVSCLAMKLPGTEDWAWFLRKLANEMRAAWLGGDAMLLDAEVSLIRKREELWTLPNLGDGKN
ncbi:hypothetical protein TNCT_81351 [Trichonephila clavata]|uniref:Uncharacterized protein n=1 Tax=Trichonephila clavata TaxID=2740835 RepID=A0A8X6HQ64_TRICU|nr:hypothetical protein TNCT_81351 [Trichonephila clavata]